jgi:hypothetical protein
VRRVVGLLGRALPFLQLAGRSLTRAMPLISFMRVPCRSAAEPTTSDVEAASRKSTDLNC